MKIVITHTEKDGLVIESFISDPKGKKVSDLSNDNEEWEDVAFMLQRAQLSLKKKKILKHFMTKKNKEKK